MHGMPKVRTDLGAQVPLVLRPLLRCVALGARRLNAQPQQEAPAATMHPATLTPQVTHGINKTAIQRAVAAIVGTGSAAAVTTYHALTKNLDKELSSWLLHAKIQAAMH